MTYKDTVVQETSGSYILPQTGAMRCPVLAFLSPKLFAMTSEDLWAQAAGSAAVPGAIGMYLMPDTHIGYSLPIGGVLVTEDTIFQSGSGYDISCGVVYLKTSLRADQVASWKRRQRWVVEVERRIATGVGSHRPDLMPTYTESEVEDILRFGAKAIGVEAHLCERQYIPLSDSFDSGLVERARKRCGVQLGSVGGGNHFVEMQVDRDDGSVWVMIHCGSRGYGWQTANHFFYLGAEHRGLDKKHRHESWLRLDEDVGRLYWDHHNAAANYAVANRHTIVLGIREALEAVFDADADVYYEISHNLVQQETLMLPDGTTKTGFVHRKGATRAFPAGHPDLVGTTWEETGHPCLIPGSMMDGAAILFPLPGAVRSGCSVNHGSGRVMGRKEAVRKLTHHQDRIDREMREVTRIFGEDTKIKGIVGNQTKTPLDECGHVYKDLDDVLAVLETEGIARVHHRLYPVANIKGK